jgi:hypothetical protein
MGAGGRTAESRQGKKLLFGLRQVGQSLLRGQGPLFAAGGMLPMAAALAHTAPGKAARA